MSTISEAKDVFISYRRNGGATIARLLCDVLNQRNISTFFDKESLGEGDFENAIEKNLHAARNFILIVSPKLFDRGRDASGQYDLKLTEADWVYREIRIALEAGKPIIPIFVDGENEFPAHLPPGVEGISKKDALTFGHDHFEPELRKLISRIKTNKDQLIDTYIEHLSHLPPKHQCEILIENCQDLDSNNAIPDIIKTIKNKIRQLLNNNQNTKLTIKAITDTLDIGFTKHLCKKLNLDNTGDISRLQKNLINWLENKEFRKFSLDDEKTDRLSDIARAFGEEFKSKNHRLKAIETAKELDIELETTRSSFDIYWDIFYQIGVTKFFEAQSKKFSEDEIKLIASRLFWDSKGRKNELIQLIADYANYEYTPEELD